MKKTLSLALAFILAISLVACGSTGASSDESAPVNSPATSGNSESAKNESQKIEAEEGIFNVVVTLPADLVGETTQEKLDAEQNDHFHKATLNADGSVSIEMSKKQHKALMEELAANIDKSLSEMVGSEDYPDITDIKSEEDYTHFIVTTKNTDLSLTESASVIGFYIYGGMYSAFNGSDDTTVIVDFVNADSGEIIATADSSQL